MPLDKFFTNYFLSNSYPGWYGNRFICVRSAVQIHFYCINVGNAFFYIPLITMQ